MYISILIFNEILFDGARQESLEISNSMVI